MDAERALFVFDTTNAVLWAEDVAREADIPCDVVPAPSDAGAGCDLALVTVGPRAEELAAALASAAVPFGRWPRSGR